jgi:trans-2-enoyl-CoA reductase
MHKRFSLAVSATLRFLPPMRLCFHQTGDPLHVLKLEPFEPASPIGHEVVVRMLYSPVNPADLNFIEGVYGKLPTFPAVPGIEGSGVVEAVGPKVESLAVGDHVIPLRMMGCWTQHLIAAENQFAKLPEGLDPVQASMLRVNPATAWQMLHEFRELEKGAFLAQNAANSGVGRAVIQIAKHLGLRTINLVRRDELREELTALGADHVLLDTEGAAGTARALIHDAPVMLALNAVGGESALHLMDLLSPNGALVTYGAMSRRSLKVPNKHLIFKGLTLHGYWLSRWMDHATHHEIHNVLRPLADMMLDGKLTLPVARIVPLTEFPDALTAARREGRSGKIILKLDE